MTQEAIARRAAKDITKGYDIQLRIEMAIKEALAQRTLVGLTDEEAQQTFARHNCTISTHLAGILTRAIETKLKQKNGYAEEKNT
jgi:hypothetical protein